MNADGGWLEPVTLLEHEEGKVYPDAPLDVYVASGYKGQMIMVSPSDNMVIVRQGNDGPGFAASTYNSLYREISAAFVK